MVVIRLQFPEFMIFFNGCTVAAAGTATFVRRAWVSQSDISVSNGCFTEGFSSWVSLSATAGSLFVGNIYVHSDNEIIKRQHFSDIELGLRQHNTDGAPVLLLGDWNFIEHGCQRFLCPSAEHPAGRFAQVNAPTVRHFNTSLLTQLYSMAFLQMDCLLKVSFICCIHRFSITNLFFKTKFISLQVILIIFVKH